MLLGEAAEIRSIREKYLPSLRWWMMLVLVGLGVATVSLAVHFNVQSAIEQRINNGQLIHGEVVDVRSIGNRRSSPQRVHVKYSINGKDYSAHLMAATGRSQYRSGERVELYVDGEDPRRVATTDHLASEDWLLLIPPAVAIYGLLAVLVAMFSAARWWFVHRKTDPASTRSLALDAVLSGDAIFGGWHREANFLAANVAAVADDYPSSIKLQVICFVKGTDGLAPKFRGARVVDYSKRHQRIVVELVISVEDATAEPRAVLLAALRDAIHAAKGELQKRGLESGSVEWQRIHERVQTHLQIGR